MPPFTFFLRLQPPWRHLLGLPLVYQSPPFTNRPIIIEFKRQRGQNNSPQLNPHPREDRLTLRQGQNIEYHEPKTPYFERLLISRKIFPHKCPCSNQCTDKCRKYISS